MIASNLTPYTFNLLSVDLFSPSVSIARMLMIRLQRVGRTHEPIFRVVVTDSKNSTKSGKFLDIVGSYDPRAKGIVALEKEKILSWISKGARVSDTLHNLLINEKIIEGKKINVLPRKTVPKKEVEGSLETPVEKTTGQVAVEDKKEKPVSAGDQVAVPAVSE